MRPHIRQFIEAAVDTFPLGGPIYEFGSFQVAGQESINDLRPLFLGQSYVGCDFRPGPGVDRVEDVSALTLADETAGTILCLETLEHVFETRRAIDEILRVLKPGGAVLISTPFHFHIHGYPSDYWRLTPSCLERLLSPLAATVVGYQGPEKTPHTVFALGFKAPASVDLAGRVEIFLTQFQKRLEQLEGSVDRWTRHWQRLRMMLATKGERRARHEYYKSEFRFSIASQEDQDLMFWRYGERRKSA